MLEKLDQGYWMRACVEEAYLDVRYRFVFDDSILTSAITHSGSVFCRKRRKLYARKLYASITASYRLAVFS